jgi:hypothetical protein
MEAWATGQFLNSVNPKEDPTALGQVMAYYDVLNVLTDWVEAAVEQHDVSDIEKE